MRCSLLSIEGFLCLLTCPMSTLKFTACETILGYKFIMTCMECLTRFCITS